MTYEQVEATKRCPFCGEVILAVAVKCKHCGSALAPGAPGVAPFGDGVPAPWQAPGPAPRPASDSPGDPLGVVLALIPWIGVALCWFWVGESPLYAASSNLSTTCALVVIGTAIAAAVDASTLGFGAKGGPRESSYGPVGTFIGVTLLWLVFYPVHMVARGRAGLPSRMAAVVPGVLAYLGSCIYLAVLINDKIGSVFGR